MTFIACQPTAIAREMRERGERREAESVLTIPASCEKAFADTKIQPGLSLVPNVTRFPHKGMSKRLFDADSVVSMASEVQKAV